MSETNPFDDQPIAWKPSREVINRAQLTRFSKQIGVSGWDQLYKKSIEDVEDFTAEVLNFLGIQFDPPYKKLLDTSEGIEWSKWCVGGGLNITEMCLDRWQTDEAKSRPALIWEGEDGEVRKFSYSSLIKEVEACAAGLRSCGLGKGDAVGIHLPMIPETAVVLLAVNRIGGIAVPVFSGYGIDAIAVRLEAVDAKALFTCDGFKRRGKTINAINTGVEAAVRASVSLVFACTNLAGEVELPEGVRAYEELIAGGKSKSGASESTLANDPAIILYTSGTTGRPKGIAHVHCGFPIKAAQDMAFGTDAGRGTRICWITDIGWMMGPWLIYGALINGATMVLYNGSPDFPEPDRIWEFSAKHRIEVLGISPTLVRLLATKGDNLPKSHDLSSLRAFASTGEPWNPAPWWWLFEKVGQSKIPIINYSGGTEISGGILMGNPLLPQKPGSFPAPCPGMNVDVLDEDGNPVERGEVGELVIKDTWIGMARGFWGEHERYLETYWNRFEKIWVHGDFAMQDKDGHWYILGRSDDTLKVAGKRVGPAEVESLLVEDSRVIEAAVIGVPDEIKGTAMVAFCVVHAGRGTPPPKLENELKALVAKEMGKPLTPKRIHFVAALPKTRNAKVMRRVVRAAYLGRDPGDLSALENPETVGEISSLE